jgi:hypothetical protein
VPASGFDVLLLFTRVAERQFQTCLKFCFSVCANAVHVPTSSSHLTGPVDQYQLGTQTQQSVGPKEFWKLNFFLRDAATLRFNASVVTPPSSSADDVTSGDVSEAAFGVYCRRGLPPTHVQYDFFRVADVTNHVKSSSRTAQQWRRRRSSNVEVILSIRCMLLLEVILSIHSMLLLRQGVRTNKYL